MTQTIVESGMSFGPFQMGYCFHVEKSEIYRRIQNNVSVAEFLLIRRATVKKTDVWVIEAKSSSPRPENLQDFDSFIKEIKNKLLNSFSLTLAACLKRHMKHLEKGKNDLPVLFQNLDLSIIDFRFILVVKGHKEEWLIPIQEALHQNLLATAKTWSFSPTFVAVLNEEMAAKHGLVSNPTMNTDIT